jgi:hypothetical protein
MEMAVAPNTNVVRGGVCNKLGLWIGRSLGRKEFESKFEITNNNY